MAAISRERLKQVKERSGPAESGEDMRTLWRARLRIGAEKDEFLFRSSEEWGEASGEAQRLLETSPSCKMVGAVIIAVERVARLWN